jgi:hypothetical protein
MYNPDHSETETRYAAAYEAMAAFVDTPREKDHLLSGYPLEQQFRIDLVLWAIERLRRMGRPVDAAWLLHELTLYCADVGPFDAEMGAFIHYTVLRELPYRTLLDLLEDERAQNEFNRITGTLVDLLESVE